MKSKNNKSEISEKVKKLEQIAAWFESQKEANVEEGLEKVREAGGLIKELEGQLAEVENEFSEIRGEIEDTE
jgi:hypothetical protein